MKTKTRKIFISIREKKITTNEKTGKTTETFINSVVPCSINRSVPYSHKMCK